MAVTFVHEKFPAHGITRIAERVILFRHDYSSTNILQVGGCPYDHGQYESNASSKYLLPHGSYTMFKIIKYYTDIWPIHHINILLLLFSNNSIGRLHKYKSSLGCGCVHCSFWVIPQFQKIKHPSDIWPIHHQNIYFLGLV